MTFKFGSCERLLMRLSVNPSERYSAPASPPTLTKGSTATELISGAGRMKYQKEKPAIARKRAPRATVLTSFLRLNSLALSSALKVGRDIGLLAVAARNWPVLAPSAE